LIDCVCFLWDWDHVSRVFRNILSITLHICDFSIYFCISLGTYLGPTYLDIAIQSFTSITCLHLRAWMLSRSLPLFKSPSLAKPRCVKLAGGLVSLRCSACLVTTPPPHTRWPSYLTQLLITLKIIVMNCMLRTGYRLSTSRLSVSPH
jgi:hypothetical protein